MRYLVVTHSRQSDDRRAIGLAPLAQWLSQELSRPDGLPSRGVVPASPRLLLSATGVTLTVADAAINGLRQGSSRKAQCPHVRRSSATSTFGSDPEAHMLSPALDPRLASIGHLATERDLNNIGGPSNIHCVAPCFRPNPRRLLVSLGRRAIARN